MDTGLGLLGLVIFVACVISLAAGTTWLIVRGDAAVRRLRKRPAVTSESETS